MLHLSPLYSLPLWYFWPSIFTCIVRCRYMKVINELCTASLLALGYKFVVQVMEAVNPVVEQQFHWFCRMSHVHPWGQLPWVCMPFFFQFGSCLSQLQEPIRVLIYFFHFFSVHQHLAVLCNEWRIPCTLCYATVVLNRDGENFPLVKFAAAMAGIVMCYLFSIEERIFNIMLLNLPPKMVVMPQLAHV